MAVCLLLCSQLLDLAGLGIQQFEVQNVAIGLLYGSLK